MESNKDFYECLDSIRTKLGSMMIEYGELEDGSRVPIGSSSVEELPDWLTANNGYTELPCEFGVKFKEPWFNDIRSSSPWVDLVTINSKSNE